MKKEREGTAVRPSLQTLLGGAIDYAGVFPPVRADMATALRNYRAYLAGPRAWALGRFVVPVSAFEELNFHIGEIEAAGEAGPLRLAALVGDDIETGFERIRNFNRWHAERDGRIKAVVESCEVKAAFSETVFRVSETAGNSSALFFEIPIEQDPTELVTAAARAGGAIKVRTGGSSRRMFPSAEAVTRFLEVCLEAGLRFKATGGLRYPLSGSRAAADAPKAKMHGFLNLFVCAAFMYDGLKPAEAVAILNEKTPEAFSFDDSGVVWRNARIESDALAGFRRDFGVSFGSASFDEPMDRLLELDLT